MELDNKVSGDSSNLATYSHFRKKLFIFPILSSSQISYEDKKSKSKLSLTIILMIS